MFVQLLFLVSKGKKYIATPFTSSPILNYSCNNGMYYQSNQSPVKSSMRFLFNFGILIHTFEVNQDCVVPTTLVCCHICGFFCFVFF